MMRSPYTAITVGGKYTVAHFLALFIDCDRSTIEVKLEDGNDVLGVGDALHQKESEKLAALSAVHQLNALGKAGYFSRYHVCVPYIGPQAVRRT
jgi:hypothetical protein